VPTDARGARRALILLPRDALEKAPLPLLVLVHGLGETNDEHAGTRAWLERYGLGSAWEQLANQSLARAQPTLMSEVEHNARVSCASRRPFQGLCVVCPYLPPPRVTQASDPKFERYARWLSDALLPAVRDRVPEAARGPNQAGIAGVSLGGLVALHAGIHCAEHYATVGSVQGAFGLGEAASLAGALAGRFRSPGRAVYVATSSFDPYRAANQALSQKLVAAGVRSDFCLRTGPHSQTWLREVGSLDLLLWHDRALRSALAQSTLETSDSCCVR
jgi:enterochelin esterase-like enzyme